MADLKPQYKQILEIGCLVLKCPLLAIAGRGLGNDSCLGQRIDYSLLDFCDGPERG